MISLKVLKKPCFEQKEIGGVAGRRASEHRSNRHRLKEKRGNTATLSLKNKNNSDQGMKIFLSKLTSINNKVTITTITTTQTLEGALNNSNCSPTETTLS
jgi:hypothetical protein